MIIPIKNLLDYFASIHIISFLITNIGYRPFFHDVFLKLGVEFFCY